MPSNKRMPPDHRRSRHADAELPGSETCRHLPAAIVGWTFQLPLARRSLAVAL